jgi:protein-disulfide isomerase
MTVSADPAFSPRPRHKRSVLETVAVVAFIVLCVVLTWRLLNGGPSTPVRAAVPKLPTRTAPPPPPPPPAEPVAVVGAPIRGSREARAMLIEYSDIQCPYCGLFARDTLPVLEKEYVDTGKVRLVFRHLPLDTMHAFARPAAESAECAGRQGKFWEMHDRLFADQHALDLGGLAASATAIGLDRKKYDACMKGDARARVDEDAASAKAFGISGTPAFFLGLAQDDGRVKVTQRISGAVPMAQLRSALDRLVASATRLGTAK